jgi:hypothetical protein
MTIFPDLLLLSPAHMAKLVDAPSSCGGAVRCAGSTPVLVTFYLSCMEFYNSGCSAVR